VTALAHRPSARGVHAEWSDRLARFGLVGKGVLHAVIGLLAMEIALNGASSQEASPAGAAEWIRDRPFGTAALLAVAASLLALAVWRAGTALWGDPVEEDDTVHRASWAAKAIFYGGLAVTFATAALSGGSSSQGSGGSGSPSTVFDWPMGRWLVVGIGLGAIAVAGYLVVHHAVGGAFAERLRCPEGSTVVTVGRVGYGLRSLAYVLVGALLVQAGLAGAEDRADGLGGALDRVADASWGTALLLGIAVGFLAYGAYCVAEAKYRRDA